MTLPAYRALLIDDEPAALAALRALLAAQPAVTVAGEAATLEAARSRLARDDYDLVFLDIQLRGGTGFDLVPHVRPGARLVFVTAYDEFAVRAFAINALDYLVKPVEPKRLAATLDRLAVVAAGGNRPAPVVAFKLDDPIYVETDGAACFVPLRQINAVLSGDNYTELCLTNGRRLLVRRPLAGWESTLPPELFVRAHRQALINVAAVERADALPDERGELHLAGLDEPVIASRRLWPALRARLAEVRLQRRVSG